MQVLIVDSTTEGQARYAALFESLDDKQQESFNLTIGLAGPNEFRERLVNTDILVFGSGLEEQASNLSVQVKSFRPDIQVLLFVPEDHYSAGAFELAYTAGVRKVLMDNSSVLDLLQELVAIQAELRRRGKLKEGRFVIVTSAKGGVGATSLAAALGEISSEYGERVLLWDFDIETHDLSRALNVPISYSQHLSQWIENPHLLTKKSFLSALCPLNEGASLLTPPEGMACSLDLAYHPDCVQVIQRIAEFARTSFDVVIIDAGGTTGPAVAALMQIAQKILIMVGDCALGVSAIDAFLDYTGELLRDNQRLGFVCTSENFKPSDLRPDLDPSNSFGDEAWSFPILPHDPKASRWAGHGKTLYSLGDLRLKTALEETARRAGLVELQGVMSAEDSSLQIRTLKNPILAKGFQKTAKRIKDTMMMFVPYRYRTVSVNEGELVKGDLSQLNNRILAFSHHSKDKGFQASDRIGTTTSLEDNSSEEARARLKLVGNT